MLFLKSDFKGISDHYTDFLKILEHLQNYIKAVQSLYFRSCQIEQAAFTSVTVSLTLSILSPCSEKLLYLAPVTAGGSVFYSAYFYHTPGIDFTLRRRTAALHLKYPLCDSKSEVWIFWFWCGVWERKAYFISFHADFQI